MKHLKATSKEMPATAQSGGISSKPTIFGFWPRNDFSFFPFNFILGFTGITKRTI